MHLSFYMTGLCMPSEPSAILLPPKRPEPSRIRGVGRSSKVRQHLLIAVLTGVFRFRPVGRRDPNTSSKPARSSEVPHHVLQCNE